MEAQIFTGDVKDVHLHGQCEKIGSYAAIDGNPLSQSCFMDGWMYVNEHGQMCSSYIWEQLSDGLSTRFLPRELLIYPVVNGKLIDPVLLKYLEHFHHKANLAANVSTMVPSEANELASRSSESFQQGEPHYLSLESQKMNTVLSNCGPSGLPILQSSEESCWMFEDEDGRKYGLHSLAKLYYWHHNNYLHDSLM